MIYRKIEAGVYEAADGSHRIERRGLSVQYADQGWFLYRPVGNGSWLEDRFLGGTLREAKLAAALEGRTG